MNFRRIQWIFLIVFLIIDIFLLFSYTSSDEFEMMSTQSSSKETTIVKEMKDDSITVGSLSNNSGTGYYISSDDSNVLQNRTNQLKNVNTSYSDDSLTVTFSKSISINTKNPAKSLNKVVKDSTRVIFGSQYVYNDRLTSDENGVIVYSQKGPDHNILSNDGQLRFKVVNGQVTGYTQTYLNGVNPLREKETTISEKKAVIWLYQHNEIPNNSQVKWAELGYTKFLTLNDHNVYIPTWVIYIHTKNTDGTQTRRINAFTGTLIKSDSNIENTDDQ